MKNLLLLLFAIALLGCKIGDKTEKEANAESKPNVLFIYVDDLRPELGIYGAKHIKSPNIDKLGRESSVFLSAFCNVPVCGASRASLLTGLRPARNRFLDYTTWAEEEAPGISTLPELFKNNGYTTISYGKTFHHTTDNKQAWDTIWSPNCPNYLTAENLKLNSVEGQRGLPYENADVPDNSYKDGKLAEKAIEKLLELKEDNKPFFMSVGFYKPHLAFNAPKKYWDMYDPEKINVLKAGFKPSNAPEEAFHNSGELKKYYAIPKEGFVNDTMAAKLVHGYSACVSYVDAQIGMVLDELKALGLEENTIIVLCGDHGWNLREHGMWNKQCNFETSLHTPLIVKMPGYKARKIDDIVEFVDVYPTLCDLAGLQKPVHLEGNTMSEIMKDPEAKSDGIAISKWFDGVTVISGNYFYTEWISDTDSIYARMLYDHNTDPVEMNNISESPELQNLIDSLSTIQREHRGKDFWIDISRSRAPVKF